MRNEGVIVVGNGCGQFLGVDFGTANTCICQWDRGTLLYEPTLALWDGISDEPVAVGADALSLMRQAPGKFAVAFPIESGVMLDFELARYMLRYFVRKVLRRKFGFLNRSKAVISVPCGMSNMEMLALEYAAGYAGLKDIMLVEEPVLAAIGEGADVSQPLGRMVVNIGVGEGCAAVVTMAGIAEYEKIEMGGSQVDKLIAEYISDKYGIQIGSSMAQHIKTSLKEESAEEGLRVTGRSILTGFPEEVFVYPEEFESVLHIAYEAIIKAILQLFMKTSPELVSDVSEEGLLFYGGGSLLYGLLEYVEGEIGLPIRLAKNPQQVTAEGAAIAASMFLSKRRLAAIEREM